MTKDGKKKRRVPTKLRRKIAPNNAAETVAKNSAEVWVKMAEGGDGKKGARKWLRIVETEVVKW